MLISITLSLTLFGVARTVASHAGIQLHIDGEATKRVAAKTEENAHLETRLRRTSLLTCGIDEKLFQEVIFKIVSGTLFAEPFTRASCHKMQ